MSEILLIQRGDARLGQTTLEQMYRLRHAVFHDRLGWEVTSDNGLEHDAFDQANPVYVLARGNDDDLAACRRLLPTDDTHDGKAQLFRFASAWCRGRARPCAIRSLIPCTSP
jgi:predicted GNAT family N-acyltransferase